MRAPLKPNVPLHVSDISRKAWLLLLSRWKTRHCTLVGHYVRVEGRLIVENTGVIVLEDRVRIRGTHVPVELAATPGGVLRIGTRTFINGGVSISAQHAVTIGARCAIGNYSLIMDSDYHDVNDPAQPGKCRPVIIEDDVWLAARVTILKGVTVGRGAVVASGAVVTHDVPPRTLVAGVPARVIRKL